MEKYGGRARTVYLRYALYDHGAVDVYHYAAYYKRDNGHVYRQRKRGRKSGGAFGLPYRTADRYGGIYGATRRTGVREHDDVRALVAVDDIQDKERRIQKY